MLISSANIQTIALTTGTVRAATLVSAANISASAVTTGTFRATTGMTTGTLRVTGNSQVATITTSNIWVDSGTTTNIINMPDNTSLRIGGASLASPQILVVGSSFGSTPGRVTNRFTSFLTFEYADGTNITEWMRFTSAGNMGIGTSSPSYQIHLSADSAAKPSTSLWTISSDYRLKTDITLANLETCYNNVKSIPLKRYTWREDVYSIDQVLDRSKLGWIAQDVEMVFPKAVEQKDMFGYSDCRSLNSDQLVATLYGAVQKLIDKVECLEQTIQSLQ